MVRGGAHLRPALSPLRRKVLRDLRRLWAQALAIALVLAAGVATLILGTGAYASLSETRARYYESYGFADVFADVTRAPRAVLADVAAIDGVMAAEARIVKLALVDIPGMVEPGVVLLVSAPGAGAGALNRLHLRQGRMPDPDVADEAVVSEGFATAHRLRPGAGFAVTMQGQVRLLRVTGIALSPEHIYALGPGEMMPDPRRFGIVWLPQDTLAAAYDLEGMFSNLVLKLVPGADALRVIAEVDRLTAPYGGAGATGRADQLSHAFLDAELKQLNAMVKVLPPIFLLVAAMLVNMTLSRLVALEREQIGLLKAMGYSGAAVARHYVEFVMVIALAGIALGFGAGAWLGSEMAALYARFFSFPFLVFARDPQIYGIAALVTMAAAVGGALVAVRAVLVLPPAVAMAPPAPVEYRTRLGAAVRLADLRQTTVMTVRHLIRWPWRTASGVLGVAMAVAILVASLWSFGSIDRMIGLSFDQAERQDVTVTFALDAPPRALFEARRLPGVMMAEPFRSVPVRISHRQMARKVALVGRPAAPRLSRVLDADAQPMAMPEAGVILSEALAEALGVGRGGQVRVDFLDGARRSVTLPVSGLSQGYVGLGAAMEIGALHRAMGEGERISGVHVLLDAAWSEDFFRAVKATPDAGFVTVLGRTVERFRATLAENITVMITVYTGLASIIAFGVIYNFARIALSEQGRELASLRVLGFSKGEVSGILFGELAVILALAQPVGWGIGHLIALGMARAFSSDLYRVPFVINPDVYATASLLVGVAALLSALALRDRINSLDMIEVLKTRE